MSTPVNWIRRHRLVSFFVLAYVIAWGPWPFYAAGMLPEPMFPAIGPLVAALVVASITEGWAGLRELGSQIIRWRVGWQWYAVAVAVPLAVIFASVLGNAGFGATPDWSKLTLSAIAMTFAVRIINPLDGPLGEEPGYRGYAVPRMQARWSPLVSTAILGVLIAIWHLPLIVNGQGTISYIGLPTTFCVTFFYVWLFNRTGGSVLLTLLSHNVQGTITIGSFGYSAAEMNRMEWLGFFAWLVVAVAVVVFDRSAWRSAPEPAVRPASRRPAEAIS